MRLPLHALPKTVRLADELQDVSLTRQAVQQGSGQPLIAEDLGPVGKAQVGGDDHSHPFVEGGAKLEDQLCAGGREGDIS